MAAYHIISLLIPLIQHTACQEIDPISSCPPNEVKADRSGVIRFDPYTGQVICTLTLTQLTPGVSLYLEGSLTAFPLSNGRCPDSRGLVRVVFSTRLTLCGSTNYNWLAGYIITPMTDNLSVTFNSTSSNRPLDLAYYHGMFPPHIFAISPPSFPHSSSHLLSISPFLSISLHLIC